MTVETVVLGSHPEWIRIIANWHWDEWGHNDPSGSLAQWIDGIAAWAHSDRMPCTLVAAEHGEPVGSVSLLAHEAVAQPECEDMTPWLSSLFVLAAHRRRGIGALLVRQCEAWARSFGSDRVYLHTSTARSFYARLGWTALHELEQPGRRVTVMTRELTSVHA